MNRFVHSVLAALVATAVLGGCATPDAVRLAGSIPAYQNPAALRPSAEPGQLPTEIAPPEAQEELTRKVRSFVVKGSDRVVADASAGKPLRVEGGKVSLNFEQASVSDVAHAVLGDLLKLDYVLHQPLSGEITLRTQAPLKSQEVLDIFDAVLTANGLAMSRDSAGVVHVGAMDAVRGMARGARRAGDKTPGFATVIVPLNHIGAGEMAEILRPLAPAEALVRVDTLRNLLVLAGSQSQMEGWLEIVRTFDVNLLSGMSVGLFPLENASVREVEQALQALFARTPTPGAQGGAGGGAGRAAAQQGGAAAAPAAPATAGASGQSGADLSALSSGPLSGLVRVVPIERLNSLLVVTPRSEYLEQAKLWIERLDKPSEATEGPRLFVYPVQNGSAAHLANLLNGLFGQQGSAGQGGAQTSGVAPGLAESRSGGGLGGSTASRRSSSSLSGSSSASGSLGQGGGAASLAVGQAGSSASQQPAQMLTQYSLGSQVRVVADEINNALLIHAPRHEYRNIESALRRLDLSPTQVLIEASIIEVSLTDETKYGLQWYFQDSLRGGWSGIGTFNPNAEGGLAAAQPGFSYSVLNPAGNVRAVLNALAKKSGLNVISSPSVLVLDNHTAAIHVGDQQPIRSQTTVTDGGTTTASIEYKDTGVLLQVTPSVNAGGMVAMSINQSVTDVGLIDEATGQRSFTQREVSSKVAIRDGETVVLGGLIRDNTSRAKAGVPVLHDIPVFGNLFGTTTNELDRTELLVMITPRVVADESRMRAVGDELRERMRAISGYLAPVAPAAGAGGRSGN